MSVSSISDMASRENSINSTEKIKITEDIVAQFLIDNPSFFHQHPELLGRIKVDTPERGAISLVEVQVNNLRERINELEEEITSLMSLAAINDQLFRGFAKVQKALLLCCDFFEAAKVIEEKALSLNLTAHIKLVNHTHPKYTLTQEALDKFLKKFLNGHSVYLGRLRQVERESLFSYVGLDLSSAELGSFAILPLGQSQPLGVIAFSSADGGHFQPSMDTVFLEQLVSVFYYLLTQWNRSDNA